MRCCGKPVCRPGAQLVLFRLFELYFCCKKRMNQNTEIQNLIWTPKSRLLSGLLIFWLESLSANSVKRGCGRDAWKGHPILSRACEEYMPIIIIFTAKVRENQPGTEPVGGKPVIKRGPVCQITPLSHKKYFLKIFSRKTKVGPGTSSARHPKRTDFIPPPDVLVQLPPVGPPLRHHGPHHCPTVGDRIQGN